MTVAGVGCRPVDLWKVALPVRIGMMKVLLMRLIVLCWCICRWWIRVCFWVRVYLWVVEGVPVDALGVPDRYGGEVECPGDGVCQCQAQGHDDEYQAEVHPYVQVELDEAAEDVAYVVGQGVGGVHGDFT